MKSTKIISKPSKSCKDKRSEKDRDSQGSLRYYLEDSIYSTDEAIQFIERYVNELNLDKEMKGDRSLIDVVFEWGKEVAYNIIVSEKHIHYFKSIKKRKLKSEMFEKYDIKNSDLQELFKSYKKVLYQIGNFMLSKIENDLYIYFTDEKVKNSILSFIISVLMTETKSVQIPEGDLHKLMWNQVRNYMHLFLGEDSTVDCKSVFERLISLLIENKEFQNTEILESPLTEALPFMCEKSEERLFIEKSMSSAQYAEICKFIRRFQSKIEIKWMTIAKNFENPNMSNLFQKIYYNEMSDLIGLSNKWINDCKNINQIKAKDSFQRNAIFNFSKLDLSSNQEVQCHDKNKTNGELYAKGLKSLFIKDKMYNYIEGVYRNSSTWIGMKVKYNSKELQKEKCSILDQFHQLDII